MPSIGNRKRRGLGNKPSLIPSSRASLPSMGSPARPTTETLSATRGMVPRPRPRLGFGVLDCSAGLKCASLWLREAPAEGVRGSWGRGRQLLASGFDSVTTVTGSEA